LPPAWNAPLLQRAWVVRQDELRRQLAREAREREAAEKKKALDEASAKKKSEDEAAARKKAEEEAAARTKAHDDALKRADEKFERLTAQLVAEVLLAHTARTRRSGGGFAEAVLCAADAQ
jgi:hypothetical protein